MSDEQLFKGPPEEEVRESFRAHKMILSKYKATTIIICGIQQVEVDETVTYPIVYTLATFGRDFSQWRPDEETAEAFPHWSAYENYVEMSDEIRQTKIGPMPQPHYDKAGWHDYETFVDKVLEVPERGFGETHSTQRQLDEAGINRKFPWYAKGKGTIYKQPTGKYYDLDSGQSAALVLAQMTQTIRNIFWTLGTEAIQATETHRPAKNVEPERLHNAIFEALKTAQTMQRLLRLAQTEGLEEGFIDYKVMVADPQGIDHIFSSVEAALSAVTNKMIEELSALTGEPMAIAAALSKDQVKQLVAAADILDERIPELAKLIDTVVANSAEQTEPDFRKADFVASLIRVADRLDTAGHRKASDLADRLLQSLIASEESSG